MPTVPDPLKAEINDKAATLIATVLGPMHLYPRPKDRRWSYPIEFYTKWWHQYLYFCVTYFTPHPDADPPTREVRFARLEYRGNKRFNLAYPPPASGLRCMRIVHSPAACVRCATRKSFSRRRETATNRFR